MSDQPEHTVSEEERTLFANAKKAGALFENYTTEQVRRIHKAIGEACLEKAQFYAEWAVRDTGFGNLQDKIVKKQWTAQKQLDCWDPADFIEPKVDHEKKIISYPKPAGTVVTLVPVTNPMLGVIGMVMQMVMTRNTLILCPHPGAKEVCIHAIEFMHDVGVAAGAPEHFIQPLREISIPAVNSLMHNPETDLILAVGGPAMVHAAYSSGNPTLGVGAANVPSYIHETADPAVAGATILLGSCFDNGVPCTADSIALVDSALADAVRDAMSGVGGYFLNVEEEQKVRDTCFPDGKINPAIVGQSAEWLADQAGISVPEGTKSLVIEITSIGKHDWVCKEKMWPVLGFKVINDGVDEAIADGLAMLVLMGKGHSANVWSEDPNIAVKYGSALPVGRVSVNAMNNVISPGIESGLCDTVMIGTGFWGGSTTSENVHPNSFVQFTHIAYHKDATMGDVDSAVDALKG